MDNEKKSMDELKNNIEESAENSEQNAGKKGMTARELNLRVSLLGSLFGVAVPQNNKYRNGGNEPIPDDIRANKKEGDEYATIGDMLRKGGRTKVAVTVLLVILGGVLLFQGLFVWGLIGGGAKSIIDYNKSGIEPAYPERGELKELAEADPDIRFIDADFEGLYKYHIHGKLRMKLYRSENGSWTEVFKGDAQGKEGYLFVIGDPSSDMSFHIISDGKSQKYRTSIKDGSYRENELYITDQTPLKKEQTMYVYYEDDDVYRMLLDNEADLLPEDVLDMTLPDGCYVLTVQDVR